MKKTKPLKVKISLTIDEDVVEKIKDLAEYDNRSLSQFINIILMDYINKNANKFDKTI